MFCFPASDPNPQVVTDKEKTGSLLQKRINSEMWKRLVIGGDLFQDKLCKFCIMQTSNIVKPAAKKSVCGEKPDLGKKKTRVDKRFVKETSFLTLGKMFIVT